MERRRFTAEFKREAAKPAKQPGVSKANVASKVALLAAGNVLFQKFHRFLRYISEL